MPNKVYMPEDSRLGGGLCFHVTWQNVEEYLRGTALRQRNSTPALRPGEVCEFVVTSTGINVYVENVNNG